MFVGIFYITRAKIITRIWIRALRRHCQDPDAWWSVRLCCPLLMIIVGIGICPDPHAKAQMFCLFGCSDLCWSYWESGSMLILDGFSIYADPSVNPDLYWSQCRSEPLSTFVGIRTCVRWQLLNPDLCWSQCGSESLWITMWFRILFTRMPCTKKDLLLLQSSIEWIFPCTDPKMKILENAALGVLTRSEKSIPFCFQPALHVSFTIEFLRTMIHT